VNLGFPASNWEINVSNSMRHPRREVDNQPAASIRAAHPVRRSCSTCMVTNRAQWGWQGAEGDQQTDRNEAVPNSLPGAISCIMHDVQGRSIRLACTQRRLRHGSVS
jgi:hypothetical protein